MKKQKLLKKVALAGISMLACVTCFGVTAINPVTNNVTADANDVALTYTLKKGSRNSGATGYVSNIWAEEVSFTNDRGQALKGVELKSSQAYAPSSTANYVVNDGYSMHYQQHLTLKIDDTIDMNEPVEFLFSPYVVTQSQQNHRFVMAISDKDGEVRSNDGTNVNGFNAKGGNYIYWDFTRSTKDGVTDQIDQAMGPIWHAVSSSGFTKYTASDNDISDLVNTNRMGAGVLARAFYGASYKDEGQKVGGSYAQTGVQALIKAKIQFTQTDLVLTFEDVFEHNITANACGRTHDLSADSSANCETCYFKQTYKLADIGFTYGQENLNLYFGYFNVFAMHSNQKYGDLPMSLKLYNYNNGDVKEFGVKDGKEVNNIKASESLDLANVMNVVYYDGATATEEVAYTSSNESIAKIVDGKVVPTAGTFGGEVTITATLGKKTATFKVNVDADTVTVNGNVVGAGGSYTILEELYTGNKVLIGYKANGALYAVGDTITYTGDIVLEEVTVDFTMLYGASIRLDATASIRFTAVINTEDLTALETLIGADKVSYGMTLVAAGKTYTIDNQTTTGFKTGTYGTDYTLYSAVMMGIPASDYETELTAQAYIKVEYADGDVVTISSKLAEKEANDEKESNVRSLADVAKAAFNDRSEQQVNEYQFADGEGKFSPYTQAQLTEIAKYIPTTEE